MAATRTNQVLDFNLRRDARPLATQAILYTLAVHIVISISDEMPGPWRLETGSPRRRLSMNFNLRRDARPLATSYGILQRSLRT